VVLVGFSIILEVPWCPLRLFSLMVDLHTGIGEMYGASGIAEDAYG
jgi:hypothetical protein